MSNEQPAVSSVETEDTTLLGEEQNTEETSVDKSEDTVEAKDDDGKDGDNGTTDEGEPNTDSQDYSDFSLPEGVELDEAMMGQAVELFKETGLPKEQAQKFIDLYASKVQEIAQNQIDTHSQLMEEWQTNAKNDKEFGGDKFEQSIGVAKQALKHFGTPELNELLETHGVGNHPEMIRLLVKVGKLTMEDSPQGSQGNGDSAPKDHATLLYGPN